MIESVNQCEPLIEVPLRVLRSGSHNRMEVAKILNLGGKASVTCRRSNLAAFVSARHQSQAEDRD